MAKFRNPETDQTVEIPDDLLKQLLDDQANYTAKQILVLLGVTFASAFVLGFVYALIKDLKAYHKTKKNQDK